MPRPMREEKISVPKSRSMRKRTPAMIRIFLIMSFRFVYRFILPKFCSHLKGGYTQHRGICPVHIAKISNITLINLANAITNIANERVPGSSIFFRIVKDIYLIRRELDVHLRRQFALEIIVSPDDTLESDRVVHDFILLLFYPLAGSVLNNDLAPARVQYADLILKLALALTVVRLEGVVKGVVPSELAADANHVNLRVGCALIIEVVNRLHLLAGEVVAAVVLNKIIVQLVGIAKVFNGQVGHIVRFRLQVYFTHVLSLRNRIIFNELQKLRKRVLSRISLDMGNGLEAFNRKLVETGPCFFRQPLYALERVEVPKALHRDVEIARKAGAVPFGFGSVGIEEGGELVVENGVFVHDFILPMF